MAITAQRYQEIDDDLWHIHEYLLALALEVDEAAPKRRGKTYQAAMDVAGQIFGLREKLQTE
jgi:hypothetical protein